MTAPHIPDLAERLANLSQPEMHREEEWIRLATAIRAELATSPELARVREALESLRWSDPRDIAHRLANKIAVRAIAEIDALTGKAK